MNIGSLRQPLIFMIKGTDLAVIAACFVFALAATGGGQDVDDVVELLQMRIALGNILFMGSYLYFWHLVMRRCELYRSYRLSPVTREVRAANARVYINTRFSAKQRVFLDFVLSHYVSVGVEELDQEKLTPLLRLKYHNSISDAVADLGRPEDIGTLFAGFQKYLYQQTSVV